MVSHPPGRRAMQSISTSAPTASAVTPEYCRASSTASSSLSAAAPRRPGRPAAGRPRLDHLVDEAALGGDERVGEAVLVFLGVRRDLLRVAQIGAVEDLHRALGAHHRDLRGRPGIVDVAAQVLGRHHVIGPAIGLAGDHRDLRHRRLAIGEQQLRAVLDDAVIFLPRARQEAGHVDEGQDRDVEGSRRTARSARPCARCRCPARPPAPSAGWRPRRPSALPAG
jgi:hypothetical protein